MVEKHWRRFCNRIGSLFRIMVSGRVGVFCHCTTCLPTTLCTNFARGYENDEGLTISILFVWKRRECSKEGSTLGLKVTSLRISKRKQNPGGRWSLQNRTRSDLEGLWMDNEVLRILESKRCEDLGFVFPNVEVTVDQATAKKCHQPMTRVRTICPVLDRGLRRMDWELIVSNDLLGSVMVKVQ